MRVRSPPPASRIQAIFGSSGIRSDGPMPRKCHARRAHARMASSRPPQPAGFVSARRAQALSFGAEPGGRQERRVLMTRAEEVFDDERCHPSDVRGARSSRRRRNDRFGASNAGCHEVRDGWGGRPKPTRCSATKVTCAFADKWVAKLAGKRLALHSAQVKLAGGPKGFRCVGGTKPAGVDMPGIAGNVDVAGNCAKGLGVFGGSPYFNWVVKRKSG